MKKVMVKRPKKEIEKKLDKRKGVNRVYLGR